LFAHAVRPGVPADAFVQEPIEPDTLQYWHGPEHAEVQQTPSTQ
jgi:hypothetical protein